MHSHYKHLRLLQPSQCTVICALEPQTSGYEPRPATTNKLHWYVGTDDRWTKQFSDKRVVEIMKKHAVPINPFVYGEYRAWFAIEDCDKDDPIRGFEGWLKNNNFLQAAEAVKEARLRLGIA